MLAMRQNNKGNGLPRVSEGQNTPENMTEVEYIFDEHRKSRHP